MRFTPIALILLVGMLYATLHAQSPETSSVKAIDNPYAKLRGISYFYIDVVTTENRIDDTEIRQDIRDTIELELRRSGLTPKELNQLGSQTIIPFHF
jgi:hypothetical protein